MKIISVETFAVQAKPIDRQAYWGSRTWGEASVGRAAEISAEYPSPLRRRFVYSKTIDTCIVRITTDDGLVGYGEAKAPVAPQVTKAIIDLLLADVVLGADARDITVLWERMYAGMRVRGHQAGFYLEAMSGIDIALWDLAGKAARLPIYQLLGGAFRNPVRVYASGLPGLDLKADEEGFARLGDEAADIQASGYNGLKMALGRGLEGDIKSVRTVRERLGGEFLIYADAAGATTAPRPCGWERCWRSSASAGSRCRSFLKTLKAMSSLRRRLPSPLRLTRLCRATRQESFCGVEG